MINEPNCARGNGTVKTTTEMSKAVGCLDAAINVLSERIDVLQARLSCVSMGKPRTTSLDKKELRQNLPPLIDEIRKEEQKIQNLYETVNNILEDLEV